jgi:amidase
VSSPADKELVECGALELVERLKDQSTNSVEITNALLQRIEVLEDATGPVALSSLAAVASDVHEQAVQRDLERARGAARGALHGVPILIKDNIEVTGLPATAGSAALVGRPSVDAPVITRLRDAGAIIVGSTNLSEWANIRSMRSTSGWSATGGLVKNPWSLDHSAGGSSSGSGAALAARLSPLALGTETDGSIVCPAALNGVVGLKPTVGVVPSRRVVPISASQDSVGAMGRSVRDVGVLYGVLSAQGAPPWRRDKPNFVHATTWRSGHEKTDLLVDELINALRNSGASVRSREVVHASREVHADELTVLLAELHDDLGRYLRGRAGEGVKSLAEVVAFNNVHAERELAHFDQGLFEQAVAFGGRRNPLYAEARARNLEWAMRDCLVPALEGADVVIGAAYGPAWLSQLGLGDGNGFASGATTAAAIAGLPIISVPVGVIDGLPVAVAIVARPNDEWTLLAAGELVEQLVDVANLRPPELV